MMANKTLFHNLMKNILRISYKFIKPVDPLVHEMIIQELCKNYEMNKRIINLEKIKNKFLKGEKILEDFRNMVGNSNTMNTNTPINKNINDCNYLVNFLIFNYHNLEYLINLTYGQVGDRRLIFLMSHYYHCTDIIVAQYKQKVKFSLEKIDENSNDVVVPLPVAFHNHIINNQLTNPHVLNSEFLLKTYKKLIHI
jgi:hypothetical protein